MSPSSPSLSRGQSPQPKQAASSPTPAHYFLNEQQLARRWVCSIKKLQADRLKGRGCVFVRLGRCVRYRLADVEAFEAAHVRTSTSDMRLSRD